MAHLFRKALLLLAVPFLAVVAFAFKALCAGLRFGFTLAGVELVWPPVLLDDLDFQTSDGLKPGHGIRRLRRARRECGWR